MIHFASFFFFCEARLERKPDKMKRKEKSYLVAGKIRKRTLPTLF
jgi:hypothetical protein